MDKRYENTAGERLNIFVSGSVFFIIVSILSLGILMSSAANALYNQAFYHLKHNKKKGPLFVTLLKDTTHYAKHSWFVSIFIIIATITLTFGYLVAESIVAYVIIYFLIFESLLFVVVSLPMMSVFKFQGIKSHIKQALLLGHLHAFSSVVSILMILTTIYLVFTINTPWNYLMLPIIVIIYFAWSSYVFYKTFINYETILNQNQ